VLEAEGQLLGQSVAINFYVASECGLLGQSNMEAAQILAIQEHLRELGTAYRSLAPYGVEPPPAALDAFFSPSDASDYDGPADGRHAKSRFLRWYLGRLEGLVGANGCAVGSALSLADVLLFHALGDSLTPDAAFPGLPAHRRESFASAARTAAALDVHPKLKAIVSHVANHPNIKKWLVLRGKQGF
jgi:glutathione S-transferase